jgi:hypothetical protein
MLASDHVKAGMNRNTIEVRITYNYTLFCVSIEPIKSNMTIAPNNRQCKDDLIHINF